MNILYRMFDADNKLLYVGLSTAEYTFARMRQHKNGSRFFSLVRTITIEHFESQGELRRAEIDAITAERPVFNRQHNKQRCPECKRLRGAHTRNCTLKAANDNNKQDIANAS